MNGLRKITIIHALFYTCAMIFCFSLPSFGAQRTKIKALYIPLADHYPGIISYEKYKNKMVYADYSIERMKNWDLLRAKFVAGDADIAFIISPMALDMFAHKQDFRWVSLIHRDGNAFAINEILNKSINLPTNKSKRKPTQQIANALSEAKQTLGKPTVCGVPHILSTHTVILHRFLKEHGKTLALKRKHSNDSDVIAKTIAPPKSPSFIKRKNNRQIPASFEQSLPWADVVETMGFGKIAWYSKDVMVWPKGHVECIVIARDETILNKREALQEVITAIHKAGLDIEQARQSTNEQQMDSIIQMIQKHIPTHATEAIRQSLRLDLGVINYYNLNTDKDGLKQIMDYALDGAILQQPIDIDQFTDNTFSTQITVK